MSMNDSTSRIFIFIIITLFVCILHASCYCILHLFYPLINIGSYSALLTAITSFLALLVAGLGAWYAKKEYNKHLEEERTKLLCDYNYRYSTDKNVECVIKWMLKIAITDKNGFITGVDRSIANTRPGIYEQEMFLRFFEELYQQIKNEKLDRQKVSNLFSYYALVFDKFEDYHLDITDYNEDVWNDFRYFVKEMKPFCQGN